MLKICARVVECCITLAIPRDDGVPSGPGAGRPAGRLPTAVMRHALRLLVPAPGELSWRLACGLVRAAGQHLAARRALPAPHHDRHDPQA